LQKTLSSKKVFVYKILSSKKESLGYRFLIK